MTDTLYASLVAISIAAVLGGVNVIRFALADKFSEALHKGSGYFTILAAGLLVAFVAASLFVAAS